MSPHADALLHSCLTGNEPPRSDAEQSWQLYLPLWSALVIGKGQPADAHADVSAWGQPTYDSLMSAVLDALRNLHLDYQKDQKLETAGQARRLADAIEVTNLTRNPPIPKASHVSCMPDANRCDCPALTSSMHNWAQLS